MRRMILIFAVITMMITGCSQAGNQEENQSGLLNTPGNEPTVTSTVDFKIETTTSTLLSLTQPTPTLASTSTPNIFGDIVPVPEWKVETYQFQSAVQTQLAPSGLVSDTGPWLIIRTYSLGVWAADAYGEGLIQLVAWNGETNASYGVFPSPKGRDLAIISGDDPTFGYPRLYIFNFPEANLLYDSDLMAEQMLIFWESVNSKIHDYYRQAYYATIYGHTWSPDGEKFAFVAALDGDSADVYVYDREANSTHRLTTGSTHAVDLVWSPDSNHIVHGGVSSLNMWAAGYGYSDYTVWDVNVSTGSISLLDDGIDYGFERHLGWTSDTTYLADTDEQVRGRYNLRIASLDGRVIANLLCENYGYREFDPVSKLLVVQADDFYPEAENCDQFEGNGYYIYRLVGNHLELVNKLPDLHIGEPFFEPHHGLFYIPQGDDGYVTVNRDGEVSSAAIEHPDWRIFDASTDGISYAYESEIFWQGEKFNMEEKLPPGFDISEVRWSPDGKAIAFLGGDKESNMVFVAHAPEFEPILVFSFPHSMDDFGPLSINYLIWVGE